MSQRKRALEKNELIGAVEHQFENLKPYLGKVAWWGLLGMAVLLIGALWWNARTTAKMRQWESLLLASEHARLGFDNQRMKAVAEDYATTQAGVMAKIGAADVDLARGISQLVTNRASALRNLESARKLYEQVLNGTPKPEPFLQQRTMFSAGYASEALGHFDEARAYYERLTGQVGETTIGKAARRGLERLNDTQATAVFSEFQAWQPETTAPGALMPRRPDISFPE
jgi:tetratricopeptide (TPR) repeat protein